MVSSTGSPPLNNSNTINTTLPTLTKANTTTENAFLVNLTHTYRVKSIPLAIFLLVLSCIFAILLAVLIVYLVRLILSRVFVGRAKSRRKKPRAIYVDEIPGLHVDQPGLQNPAWLQYSIEYQLKQQVLIVGIMQINNLISQSDSIPATFYVTLNCDSLNPKTGRVRSWGKGERTKITELSSGICSWSDLFSFSVPEKEIPNLRLLFRIYECIPDSRDFDHGHLSVTLKDEDMSEYVGTVMEKTGVFGTATRVESHSGELCVGMAYYPREEKLDVHILEAAQLQLSSDLRPTDQGYVYVTVSLRTGKHILKKFDTDKRKELQCPYFNQKFSFKLKDEHRDDAFVCCSIKYSGGWGSKKHLGRVLIGSSSLQNSGIKQWEETIKYPSKVHILWHQVIVSKK